MVAMVGEEVTEPEDEEQETVSALEKELADISVGGLASTIIGMWSVRPEHRLPRDRKAVRLIRRLRWG